jgi:hypothetical protein
MTSCPKMVDAGRRKFLHSAEHGQQSPELAD